MPATPPTVPVPIHIDGTRIRILDQTRLPHEVVWLTMDTVAQAAHAIRTMQVRGAPLIGAVAAWGVALAMRAGADDATLADACHVLGGTRPTAVNLAWALTRMAGVLQPLARADRAEAAWREALRIGAEDAAANHAIGTAGLVMLREIAARRPASPTEARPPLHLMTHCNAGVLATTAFGTATAPMYAAHTAGLSVHVFVSETRPRNQGLLTAWELGQAGVPHTLMADNAAGHLLAIGRVDAVLVGADRIAANGDAANKVGTYLKALAARAAGVPFYVCAPLSTVDFSCPDGGQIPIEERASDELCRVQGTAADGTPANIRIAPDSARVANPAFDVTPASLITGIITERGICTPAQLASLRHPHN